MGQGRGVQAPVVAAAAVVAVIAAADLPAIAVDQPALLVAAAVAVRDGSGAVDEHCDHACTQICWSLDTPQEHEQNEDC